jgi:hypothetical protein
VTLPGDRRPSADIATETNVDRWTLSPPAAAFVRDRAELLKTDPATVLDDLILVERRRVEGSI